MTELLDREKKVEGTLSEATEVAARPVRVSRTWALLAAAIFAAGVGWFTYTLANGSEDTAAQAAEARAEEMVEVHESRWLSDPANIAALRAQDMVEVYESRALSDPAYIQAVRAQDMVDHYENLWRFQSGQ